MYSSEYLRNKKTNQAKLLVPTFSRDSSAYTETQRYKNSAPINNSIQNAGQMLELSSDNIVANKGRVAVCCSTTISSPIIQESPCCKTPDSILYPYPTNFIQPPHPDCCPVNGPPIIAKAPCCSK